MKSIIHWKNKLLEVDLAKPSPISIPIKDGDENPNCYFAEPVKFETIRGDNFVGSVKLGGVVNHQKLTISPHGNGTHTECYGHITDSDAVIAKQLHNYFHIAQLIDVTPTTLNDDKVIAKSAIEVSQLKSGIRALVIRTKPNNLDKLNFKYSGTNPVYFTEDAMQLIVDHGIDHLVTDLPSVDKEVDGGQLLAHKAFWQTTDETRTEATITELAFIPDTLKSGLYLLDLQVLSLNMDASPSNPVLYNINNESSLEL